MSEPTREQQADAFRASGGATAPASLISQSPADLGLRDDPLVSPALGTPADREAAVMERLKEVMDPELGINIVDLGLLYGVAIDDAMNVRLDMTLTTPACPLTDQLEWGASEALSDIAASVEVNWVWLPPWTMDMITEDGREQLRYIGYNV